MTKALCTFPGPNGDILWSLPTAKALADMYGESVDFGVMPYYENLLPLIANQPYISKAFVVKDWIRLHSNYGDQPWAAPKEIEEGYEHVHHLGYRGHPGLGGGKRLPLIDFTADQQGVKLRDPLPFLLAPRTQKDPYVAVGFNPQYPDEKTAFLNKVKSEIDIPMVDTTVIPWLEASQVISDATCFVGCRSSNFVISHGVGQKFMFIFDPHPARAAQGFLGDVFGCPYAYDINAPLMVPPEVSGSYCASKIKEWIEERKQENAKTT